MTFSDFNSPSNKCFKSLGLLKLSDLIKFNNVILTHRILNKNCPSQITNTLSLSFLNHDYETRGRKINLLSKPNFRTYTYGKFSVIYQAITQWNELQAHFRHLNLSILKLNKIKSEFQKFLLSHYDT